MGTHKTENAEKNVNKHENKSKIPENATKSRNDYLEWMTKA